MDDKRDMSLDDILKDAGIDDLPGGDAPTPQPDAPAPEKAFAPQETREPSRPAPRPMTPRPAAPAPAPVQDDTPRSFGDDTPKIRRMSDSTRAREIEKSRKRARKARRPDKKAADKAYTYEKERPEGEYAYTQIHGAKRAAKRKKVKRTPDLTAAGTETIHFNIQDIISVSQAEPEPVEPVEVEPAPRAAHTSLDLRGKAASDAVALDVSIRRSKEEAEAENRRRKEQSDRMGLETTHDIRADIAELRSAMSFRTFALGVILVIAGLIAVGDSLHWWWVEGMHPVMMAVIMLLLGFGACAVCTPVLRNGFTRLIKLQADTDSVAAAALAACMGSCCANLVTSIGWGTYTPYFLPCAVFALLLHSVGKLLIVDRELTNLRFVHKRFDCYGLTIVEDEQRADALTRGVLPDFPILATMRHTDQLHDFRKYTYSADLGDRFCRLLAPVEVCAGLIGAAVLTFLRSDTLSFFFHILSMTTVAASCAAVTFVVNLPLLAAAHRMVKHGALMLGYQSVDDFYDTNSIMLDAATLFPEGSVKLAGVRMFTNVKTDEILLNAASLTRAAGSVFGSMWGEVLQGREKHLFPVESYQYEDGLGLSGWIHSQRILLGSRDLMTAHNIEGLPSRTRESEMVGTDQEAIYMSVSGNLAAVFLVELTADRQVKYCAQSAQRHDLCLVLRSVDPTVTVAKLARLFDIVPDMVKVIPSKLHDTYALETSPVPSLSASMASTGSFVSVAQLIVGAKILRRKAMFGVFVQAVAVLLGLGLVVLETVLHVGLTPGRMLLFQLLTSLLTILAVNLRKTI